jgi:Na+-translocating ferredoxin:NAD+ oxidoreductase subunit B
MKEILITLGFSAILAFILGIALGFFKQKFHVETDPKVEQVRAALPGANCGGCGYPGCDGYAAAIASGKAPIGKCAPGGKDAAETIAKIMGVTASAVEVVAVLRCQGTKDKASIKGNYVGVPTCRAAKLSTGGTKTCSWGCMGYGDCTAVCKFDALSMGDNGLPQVDYAKCTGCGMCAAECPQGLFALVPKDRKGAIVLCQNRNVIKPAVAKACKAGCIKCEICVKSCPEKCITMENGIPVTDYSKCTACGTCVSKCPTKCYRMLENGTVQFAPEPEKKAAPVA